MPVDFEEFLFSARSFDEYLAMFDLETSDVTARWVLDCPGGASSFGCDSPSTRVVAIDPLYREPTEGLAQLAHENVLRGNQFIIENPQNFSWGWFADPADHLAKRTDAVDKFVSAVSSGSRAGFVRVASELPRLPFAERTFDLTLSSHFLFTYEDRLSPMFHVDAIAEMVRVTRGEVRVFPLSSYQMDGRSCLEEVRAQLADGGIETEIRRVPYEFQRGVNEMLVALRVTPSTSDRAQQDRSPNGQQKP